MANEKVPVTESVFITEKEVAELAQIGSKYLYLGAMYEGRISYGGIIEILKKYESSFRKTDIEEFNNRDGN